MVNNQWVIRNRHQVMSLVVTACGQVWYDRSTRSDFMENVPCEGFTSDGKTFIAVHTTHRSLVIPTFVSLHIGMKKRCLQIRVIAKFSAVI